MFTTIFGKEDAFKEYLYILETKSESKLWVWFDLIVTWETLALIRADFEKFSKT